MRILPRGEEGLRAVISQAKSQAKDQAPRAEAAAARWVERTRPVWSWFVLEWHRLGTVAAVLLDRWIIAARHVRSQRHGYLSPEARRDESVAE